MTTNDIETAQILWRARDEMIRASDEFRAAMQVLSAVADDMSWRSSAARGFQDSVGQLVTIAERGVVECVNEADALLAQGNRLVLR